MNKFSVNTTLGLNAIGGYVLGFGHYEREQDQDKNMFDFDISQYDMKYMSAYKLKANGLELDSTKKQEIDKELDKQEKLARIDDLKKKLADTDYIYNSIREGGRSEEYYADVIANRKAWRKEIQDLEEELGL